MRIPSLLTALSLLGALALACGGRGSGPPPIEPEVIEVPYVPELNPASEALQGHGYGSCELTLLSGHWQVERGAAGERASAMILGGRADAVEAALRAARGKVGGGQLAGCTFADTDFSMEDAELLARAWGTSLDDAKATLASKATWGSYPEARAMIEAARSGPAGPTPEGTGADDRALAAFLRSERLDACHARMLAQAWGSSLQQAKVILGHKLLNGHEELLQGALGDAREHARQNVEARCTWADVRYTWDDAQALARLWNTSVEDAKARVVNMYLDGDEANLPGILLRARRR